MSLRTLEYIVPASMLSWQLSRRAGLTVCISAGASSKKRKEGKRKDHTFRRQFNEKPSIILGCPGCVSSTSKSCIATNSSGTMFGDSFTRLELALC